ncbi:MAG: hypothetical protein HKM93_06950 [Desulfobacteraceae bacterium]|nr:hypothetical protein [Desulfobacteraceae bacterium]
MAFFEAVLETIIAIVAIVMICQVLRSFIKSRHQGADRHVSDLDRRIDRLEDRLANLETIVLDKERFREFDDLEKRKVS